MDEVASSGEPIVITKRGKPVAQLAPISARPKTLRGFLKGAREIDRGHRRSGLRALGRRREVVTVLDTHALVWFAEDHPQLGRRTTTLVNGALARDELAVSAISFWEITRGSLKMQDARR
jgi:prevent-host-death family protein